MNRGNLMPMNRRNGDAELLEKYGFLVTEKRIRKGWLFPVHWHDYFECEIILEGRAEHRHNRDTEILVPGGAYLLSYFDTHAFLPLTDMRIFTVRFNESFLSPEITRLISAGSRNCRCHFDEEELTYLGGRIERIRQQDSRSPLYEPMMTALLCEIILLIIDRSHLAQTPAMSSLVQEAAGYIIRHFREPISLGRIAAELSVTPKYLGALFCENTGMSFHEYLNSTRLRYACNLLTTSELSVKEIAYSSGYASVEYFLDVFKRRIGMTPTRYRQQNRTEP